MKGSRNSLTSLRIFAAAARTLNFSRTAEAMHLTQSAVSKHIAALETRLGCALFKRMSTGLRLTHAGAVYLERIAAALRLIDEAEAMVSHPNTRVALNLAVSPSFAQFCLIPALPEFFERHPGVRVNVRPRLLSGSSGRPRNGHGIPAAYIDAESAQRLAGAPAGTLARLVIEGEEVPDSRAAVGVFDLPGGRDSRIVISAHVDGHDLGVSALDNATGVAVALAAARLLAPRVGPDTAGLRVCLFCAEEWALAGSARYLDGLEPAERARLKLNINLDTVAGDASLTALISGFEKLGPLVGRAAQAAGVPVETWLPLMPNSDHANFARHGIPALRLVAGFGKPSSRVNRILSAGDVPALIREDEMRQALAVTAALADLALAMGEQELDALRGP